MLPSPAALLRHRPPALLLATIDAHDGGTLWCTSVERETWVWPEILEGAAQCAGLLAGFQPGGPGNRAVIAEYRNVRPHAATARGTIRLSARLERRVLRFWRCRVEACDAGGTLLLDGLVTLAPGTS
jgi:hypothetical protein